MEDNNISLEENTAKASVSDEKKLFLSNLRTVAITVVAVVVDLVPGRNPNKIVKK